MPRDCCECAVYGCKNIGYYHDFLRHRHLEIEYWICKDCDRKSIELTRWGRYKKTVNENDKNQKTMR